MATQPRSFQHKVAFRKAKVLHECNFVGKKLEASNA